MGRFRSPRCTWLILGKLMMENLNRVLQALRRGKGKDNVIPPTGPGMGIPSPELLLTFHMPPLIPGFFSSQCQRNEHDQAQGWNFAGFRQRLPSGRSNLLSPWVSTSVLKGCFYNRCIDCFASSRALPGHAPSSNRAARHFTLALVG